MHKQDLTKKFCKQFVANNCLQHAFSCGLQDHLRENCTLILEIRCKTIKSEVIYLRCVEFAILALLQFHGGEEFQMAIIQNIYVLLITRYVFLHAWMPFQRIIREWSRISLFYFII